MQAIFRSTKERILSGAAFCGGKCIRAFSIPERVPVPAFVSDGVSKIAGRQCVFVIPVNRIGVFS
ncbi:hypothetical protein BTK96_005069 [Burkholderia pyrrocinia]|uniref:hypothetical protein n=1 Tax=Burkholderia sp. IT-111MI5 TaxID=3026439 RepID=UPI002A2C9056|nr:hypothetical protein [Burkholderia pyrrocinia]EKS9897447.1 hypothetical protein [Burkholderia pyrrocinia]EKS9910465.1 hypothetical protein [Burkholderia pyrrocinia]